MRMTLAVLVVGLLLSIAAEIAKAQLPPPRRFGARSFVMDDGTGSGQFVGWDVQVPITSSYTLRLPPSLPTQELHFFAVDPQGNVHWEEYMSLPNLTRGHIWCGDNNNWAWEMPPGPTGSILSVDGTSMPNWVSTISASIISSGVLQPGVVINVGNGALIAPSGTGLIVANNLTGSGPNKYAGSVPIPQFALTMNISYSDITAGSTVLVTVSDPSGQTDGVSVTGITPGVGFSIAFTGYYPTTTGSLNYIVAR